MKKIFQQIWELAKPFYQEGRSYDIEQIEWMVLQAERLSRSLKIEEKILLPLVILHDVGYYQIKEKNPNIKDVKTKKGHMKKGSQIAKKILTQVNYDKELIDKIVYYISVHDNWLLDDHALFRNDKLLALFNDLDFLFVTASFKHFKVTGESIDLEPKEFYKFWKNDEKLTNRPFCCEETSELFKKSMKEINKSL